MRIFIFFMLTFLVALTILGNNYEKFFPLLKNISGWKSQKPIGSEMTIGEDFMMGASRKYSKGDKIITVSMLVGSDVGSYEFLAKASKNCILTSDRKSYEVKNINSFRTLLIGGKDNSKVVVFFNSDSMKEPGILIFFGEHVRLNTLLPFSKNFNWKKFENLYRSIYK